MKVYENVGMLIPVVLYGWGLQISGNFPFSLIDGISKYKSDFQEE